MDLNNIQTNDANELAKIKTVKVYLKDNINMMLFSELVSSLSLPEMREEALREIVKRMEFCNIDQAIAKRMIQVEKKILESKLYNRPDNDYLIRKVWWPENTTNGLFQKKYEKYELKFDNLSGIETLTLSDLIALTGEANYIYALANKKEKYADKILDEINDFTINKDKKFGLTEFQRRMCFYFTWIYNDTNKEKLKEFQVKALNLFYNELRIITKYKYNAQDEEWEPYTKEYFDRERQIKENLKEVECPKCKIKIPVSKNNIMLVKEFNVVCPECNEKFVCENDEYKPIEKLELKDIALKCREIVKKDKKMISELYESFKEEEIERDLRKFKNDENLLINITLVCVSILCKNEHTKENMINTLEKTIDGANENDRLENQKENLESPFNAFPDVFNSLNPKTKYFAKKVIQDILEKYENNEKVI